MAKTILETIGKIGNKSFIRRITNRLELSLELFIARFLDVNPLDTANKPVYFVIIHGAEHVDYILEFEIVSNVRTTAPQIVTALS